MLTVVTGRSGSGKSGRCIAEFNHYLQHHSGADSCAYFFVPEQYTMITERRLLEFQYTEDFPVKGLIGHEVLNFKRFSHRILSIYGGVAESPLNECGKIMMLTFVLDRLKGRLQYFGRLADKPGETARLLSLLDEFGKYGVTDTLLSELKTEDAYLNRKLSDLSLILQEYQVLKRGTYVDENDVFDRMLVHVKETEFFKEKHVWIDSFTGFTRKELDLITLMLMQCRKVTVTLCTDLQGEPAFACTDHTLHVLTGIADRIQVPYEVMNLSTDLRSNQYKYQNQALHALEQALPKARCAVPYSGEATGVFLTECAGPYEEVVRCAERIRKLRETDHTEYRYIAVALRDVGSYDVLIKTIFKKYGIPFYIDDKKTLDNNPLIKTILAVLNIIADDWQARDVLECLKSGILHFGGNPDVIENTIVQKGLRGRSRWKKETEEACALFFSEIDAFAVSLSNCTTIKECCVAFCLFLNHWELRNAIETVSVDFRNRQETELADEYSRIWNITMEVVEQIVLFLGDISVSGAADAAGKMQRLLSTGFAQFKIGFLPSSVNRVQVINMERSRSARIKALFLLGANDGILPAHFSDDGILRDQERELLKAQNVVLADDSEAKASKENYFIYAALSLPSEILDISYSLEDLSGNESKPSPVLLRKLKAVFPHLKITCDTGLSPTNPHQTAAKTEIGILHDINADLFRLHGTLQTTVSRIESYYKCPFEFFLSYGLGLKPREEAEIRMYDLGNVMHAVIDAASESLYTLPPDAGPDQCREIIESVYGSVAEKMRFSGLELTKREEHALLRIRESAVTAFYHVKRQLASGAFSPCGFEVPFDFGEHSLLKPIVLYPSFPSEFLNKINIVGRIDRYDMMEADGMKYVRVIDYKSSHVTLTESELCAGIKLQLITYLNAVIDSYPKGTVSPGGALYFKFGDDISSVSAHISGAGKIEKDKQFLMNGFVLDDQTVTDGMTGGFDTGIIGGRRLADGGISFAGNSMLKTRAEFDLMKEQAYDRIREAASAIAEGRYPIVPSAATEISPCKYCEMRSVCASCGES